jgi:beta-lactamase superfamily II metal-dependent hydrolase
MELVADFWDVGQGDCSVVRLPDDKLLVIDVGPPDSPLIEWLMGRSERIHAVVLTHNDEDHAGSFPDLIERFGTRIDHVFLLVDRHTTDRAAQRILGAAVKGAKRDGYSLHPLDVPNTGTLPIYGFQSSGGDLVIYAVHPEFVTILGNQLKKSPTPNAVSAVVRLDVDGVNHLVWAGDAPMRAVADKCEGLSPVAMVGPHHGAPSDRKRVGYPKDFDRIDPENVYVSVGTGNRNDHPVKKFIDLHRERGRRVVCSQLNHCDKRRVEHRRHVMRNHLELGLVPPLNSDAVSCRGPMRLVWDAAAGEFLHDAFHEAHLAALNEVHRPYCLGGLVRKS